MANGHSVKLAAPSRFKNLVEGYGIRFVSLPGEPEDLSQRLNDVGFNFVKMVREMMEHGVEIGVEMLRQTEDACADADLIIHTFAHGVGAHTLRVKRTSLIFIFKHFPCLPPRILFFDADESYKPSIALQNFLDVGKPPIYISFGSMVNRDANRIDKIVRIALEKTNSRGVILSGWGAVKDQASDNLICFDAVPHDRLLPRCKMIIHHGGAETTSAGLRAGIANVVVPFTAD